MDDPWGSPWAATDPDRDLKPGSPAKSDIAPPPRAFLSASSSPRISAVSEQSPWGGDDNGSGEWATAMETPAHSIWAGGWGASNPNLLATPRDNKTSPIALPGNIATPKPANGSVFRQPSPDPWGSGFSSRKHSFEAASTPRLVIEAASPVDAPITTFGALGIEQPDTVWDKSDTASVGNPEITIESDPPAAESEEGKGVEEQTTPVAAPGIEVRSSVESTAPTHGHQSPTPSNDNTDHEEDRQDSPITSIDEEPRGLSAGSRKASGKVQELVVKFDGIARAASEERDIVIVPTNLPSAAQKGGSGDVADFGEFEDANADRPSSPSLPSASELGTGPVVEEEPIAVDEPPPDNFPLGPSVIAQFGPIHFGVDLGLVAKLFNNSEAASDPDVDYEVPDHVIEDSFTNISERKTWYRISRLGSSRRHNAGNDDSYRRVAWATSTVHDDTIKIVRRWMEEDSIAGRVALGGGISKTQKNMFGWDSSVEPVTLDDVFRKKSPRSRTFSVQQPPRATGLSLHLTDAPSKRPPQRPIHHASNSAGPGVPSFGWNTASSTTTAHARSISVIPVPPSVGLPGPTSQIPTTVQGAKAPDNAAATNDNGDDDDDDDDDEWGEMVSSPVVASQPQPIPLSSVTKTPAVGPSLTASVPRDNNILDHTPAAKGTSRDPLGETDVSALGSAPAKPGLQHQALNTIPELVDHSTPGPAPENSAPVPLGATTANHPSISPTPITAQKPSASGVQREHEKTAQWIIANLPDLSYMLR